ncbi:MAG: serine protein kinase RIO [Thermococci archaeon]|nr:serine protein kinase RIO [Thermococci archaeon]
MPMESIDREIDKLLGLRRDRDSETFKVANEVFDRTTVESLSYLIRRRKLTELRGVLSTGKEANVFLGMGPNGEKLAVKIYRTYTTEFRRIWEHLAADPRIGYLPKDVRKLVMVWTRREFKNLQRAIKYAVRVPEPVAFRNNVLIMEFIGGEGPAPRLKDVELERKELEETYEYLIRTIERLWRRGDMVHGDLSEYNVLIHGGPVVIDWSQATVRRNRRSLELLRRDVFNVTSYFRRKGLDVEDPLVVYENLVG